MEVPTTEHKISDLQFLKIIKLIKWNIRLTNEVIFFFAHTSSRDVGLSVPLDKQFVSSK